MECQGKVNSIVQVHNVSKKFKSSNGTIEILKNISFDVAENEFVVLFGPGQCGKTTLLKMIAGLETSTDGEIIVDGKKVTEPGPDKAFVYQNISLFPWLTVMGNVEFGPKARGIDKDIRQKNAKKYIKLVGLEGFENTYPVKLSGGMKQRVGIARAYCNESKLMLMDEPFGALDAQTRYLMQAEVVRISENEKRTVVFVTNNVEEAIYLADRIVVMTDCPSSVQTEVKIDLPRPRSYVDPKFLHLRHAISEMVHRVR